MDGLAHQALADLAAAVVYLGLVVFRATAGLVLVGGRAHQASADLVVFLDTADQASADGQAFLAQMELVDLAVCLAILVSVGYLDLVDQMALMAHQV